MNNRGLTNVENSSGLILGVGTLDSSATALPRGTEALYSRSTGGQSTLSRQAFSEILEGMALEDFVRQYWMKSFRHIEGRKGRFSHLLTWFDLNKIVCTVNPEPPRLQLLHEGKILSSQTYVDVGMAPDDPRSSFRRLNATRLSSYVREGATLVLNAIDDYHEPVTNLACDLEGFFGAQVGVNMYASWRTAPGLEPHFDSHEVFVLQVAGKKYWKVYDRDPQFCVIPHRTKDGNPPTQLLWEGIVRDGDILYVPRGYWHVATPVDEPTIHLAVGVYPLTIADFLEWSFKRLRSNANSTISLSQFENASHAEQRIRAVIMEQLNLDTLGEFFLQAHANSRLRPTASLPRSAQARFSLDDARLRWSGSRTVNMGFSEELGAIIVGCDGKLWHFALPAGPVLDVLVTRTPCTVQQLCSTEAGSGLDHATVERFLQDLVINGLISIESCSDLDQLGNWFGDSSPRGRRPDEVAG